MTSETGKLAKSGPIDPFIKWLGGKRARIEHLKMIAPKTFNRYFEPFFRGRSTIFSIRLSIATLSDNNEALINCYIQVRDNADEVIKRLRLLKNSEQD